MELFTWYTFGKSLPMKHLHRHISHHIKHHKRHYSVASGILAFSFLLFAIFFATRGPIPFTSELAFIEKSTSLEGSVIPASCSSTGYQHLTTYCPAWDSNIDPECTTCPSPAPAPSSCVPNWCDTEDMSQHCPDVSCQAACGGGTRYGTANCSAPTPQPPAPTGDGLCHDATAINNGAALPCTYYYDPCTLDPSLPGCQMPGPTPPTPQPPAPTPCYECWCTGTCSTPQGADLHIETFSPTTARPNISRTFAFSMHNQGDTVATWETSTCEWPCYNATNQIPLLFQVSTLPDGGGSLTNTSVIWTGTLQPDQRVTINASHLFTSIGTYYARVCADKRNQSDVNGVISEADENNNCYPWTAITVSNVEDISCDDEIAMNYGQAGNCQYCPAPQVWNGSSCVSEPNPPTITVVLIGNRTPNGTLQLTCTNSTTFSIERIEGATGQYPLLNQSYTGATSKTVTVEGNYRLKCTKPYQAAVSNVYYDPNPVSADEMSITASPRTVSKGGAATVSWKVMSPPQGVARCRITATAVCAGGSCATPRDDARVSNAQALSTQFSTGTTDANDPYGASRTMTSALTTPTDKALGKKTVTLQYTTDFNLKCGAVIQKARVEVGTQNEG